MDDHFDVGPTHEASDADARNGTKSKENDAECVGQGGWVVHGNSLRCEVPNLRLVIQNVNYSRASKNTLKYIAIS